MSKKWTHGTNFMIISFKNSEDFLYFLKKCKNMGVTRIKMGEVELDFSPPESKAHRPKRNANASALATKLDGVEEEMTDDEEFELSQLRINDPEAYEELEIKRMREDGQ